MCLLPREDLPHERCEPRNWVPAMLTCLICGGDMQQDTAEVTELLLAHGCVSTTTGSDGREFQFANGERLEVGGMCNACDEKEIRQFLDSK
jgi:hypothetical protein